MFGTLDDPGAAPIIDLHHVIYPEDIFVTDECIIRWALDTLVDAAVDDHVKANGVIPDTPEGDALWETFRNAANRELGIPNPGPDHVALAKEILSDAGSHTFARS